jgi:hypothetical protein
MAKGVGRNTFGEFGFPDAGPDGLLDMSFMKMVEMMRGQGFDLL